MRTFIIPIMGHLEIWVALLFWVYLCFSPLIWTHEIGPEMWSHWDSISHVCHLPPSSLLPSLFTFAPRDTIVFWWLFFLQMFCMDWDFWRIKIGRSCTRRILKRDANEKSRTGDIDELIIEVFSEGSDWTKLENE